MNINNTELMLYGNGCYHRNVVEQNMEYTITYCALLEKEISSHGEDCVRCKNNPYYLKNKKERLLYDK